MNKWAEAPVSMLFDSYHILDMKEYNKELKDGKCKESYH